MHSGNIHSLFDGNRYINVVQTEQTNYTFYRLKQQYKFIVQQYRKQ